MGLGWEIPELQRRVDEKDCVCVYVCVWRCGCGGSGEGGVQLRSKEAKKDWQPEIVINSWSRGERWG